MRLTAASHPPHRALALLAALAALLVVAAPAAATMWDRVVHYDDFDSYSYDDCGFTIDVEGHYWGTFATRQGTGPDAGAFFGQRRYAFREVQTSEATGVTIIVAGYGRFAEVKGTLVEGSVFEFSAINAGTSTISDEDGNVLARNAGTYRESILFDTLGDDVPGGDFIAQTSWQVHGPHPGDELDWCALFE